MLIGIIFFIIWICFFFQFDFKLKELAAIAVCCLAFSALLGSITGEIYYLSRSKAKNEFCIGLKEYELAMTTESVPHNIKICEKPETGE